MLDGGSMLVSIADGCCGEGSSNKPANDRDRGREHQRARTRFTLAGFRRIAGMQRSLPRRGAATHHACPAWYPFRAPSSPRSGAGGQEFDLPGLSILANVRLLLLMLFSPEPSGKPAGPNSHTRRAASFAYPPPKPETRRLTHKLPPSTWKASRTQRPHKTHRPI